MAYDLASLLTGGAAARSDSLSGLRPEYRAIIERMVAEAPPDIGRELRIMSAYRSPETQAGLWKNALAKYGSEAAARRWVAPPGRSQHGMGNAIDWQYLSPAAGQWVRANAGKYGAVFPLSNEPWHMEIAGARRGGGAPGVSLAYNPISTPAMGAAPTAATSAGGGSNPMGMIAQALQGRRSADPSANQIIPSSISQEVGGGTQASAGQLLLDLLDKHYQRGLSLNGGY